MTFASRSGFAALGEKTKSQPLFYGIGWERLGQISWTAGYILRRFGNWFYGSEWNALIPLLDERKFLSHMPDHEPFIVHFLWAEFASPKWANLYRRKGARVIGGFHCSPRRWEKVLGKYKLYDQYDFITLTSTVQLPMALAHGVPKDKIGVIPLGVDTDYFCPVRRYYDPSRPVRAIVVGETERDHSFLSRVIQRLGQDNIEFLIRTSDEGAQHYSASDRVKIIPRLTDEQLVRFYQEADLMVMPMLDSAANDAILEAMACGTPVMVNKIGGVAEYVNETCNYVMEHNHVDDWVEVLLNCADHRELLEKRRQNVRLSAMRFSWDAIAPSYLALYRKLLK